MHVYFLETERSVTDVVSFLKKRGVEPFLVLRPELGCFDALLEYSLFLAYKAFQTGTAQARDLSIQWLSFLSATRQVDKALSFATPKSKTIAIASEKPVDAKSLAGLGEERSFTCPAEAKKELATHYGISEKALELYSLQDLLQEKIALASIS